MKKMVQIIDYETCMKQKEAAKTYAAWINDRLRLHTRDAWNQFVQLYMQEEFVHNYMASTSELISGRVLAMITCDELVLEKTMLYADQFDSLEQFILAWDEWKFALWEMEFLSDESAKDHFMNMIAEKHISDITLKYLLHTSAVDKKDCLLQIAERVLEAGDAKMALLLLQHGCELCPEDQEIPQLLKELQAVIGG